MEILALIGGFCILGSLVWLGHTVAKYVFAVNEAVDQIDDAVSLSRGISSETRDIKEQLRDIKRLLAPNQEVHDDR